MNYLFLDSNIIVKYYITESGSEWVRKTVDSPNNTCLVCEISIVEVAAAFAQIQRDRRFGKTFMRKIYQKLLDDLQQETFVAQPLDRNTIDLGSRLALRHILKGYDAIQIAAAMHTESILGTKITFISNDKQAIRAASAEKLLTQTPIADIAEDQNV